MNEVAIWYALLKRDKVEEWSLSVVVKTSKDVKLNDAEGSK